MPETSDWQNDKTTLNSSALQKFSTAKPGTSSSHSSIITALITNRNSPKVNIVAGSVKSISTGFTKILSKPSTNATSNAADHPCTATPGNRCESISTNIVVNIILITVFIYLIFCCIVKIQKSIPDRGCFYEKIYSRKIQLLSFY